MTDRQADRLEHLVRVGSLHRQHGVRLVVVGDRDPVGLVRLEPALDLGAVGGVGDEQHVVVVVEVGDQVVDDATGRGVAGQGVLRPARADPAEVVGQAGVEVLHRAVTADHDLAEVADVEDPDRAADRGVLLEDPGGVLQRHLPAAELGELGPEGDVAVVQRRVLQGHALQVTAAPRQVEAGHLLGRCA